MYPRFAMARAFFAFCSTITTEVPLPLISTILENTISTSFGARPADGSSIRRISGSSIIDFARATICCSPPLRFPALSRNLGRRFGKRAIVSMARLRICESFIMRGDVAEPRLRFQGIGTGEALRVMAPISRFSRTVRDGNVLFDCGT